MKFEGDKSNPLKIMISQTQEFEKAIIPLFADPVTFIEYHTLGRKTSINWGANLMRWKCFRMFLNVKANHACQF